LSDSQFINVTPDIPGQKDYNLAWSTDGEKIIFKRDDRLLQIDAFGGQVAPFGQVDLRYKYSIELSPDGKFLAYNSWGNIFIEPINGGEPINLSQDISDYLNYPTWSPDGTMMACRAKDFYLVIYKIESNKFIQVKEISSPLIYNILWSNKHPTLGSHILIHGGPVRIYNPQTEKIFTVQDRESALSVSYACWSPDGTKIAYTRGDQYLYLKNIFVDLTE